MYHIDIDEATREAQESRLLGDYTVVHKEMGIAYLSKRLTDWEEEKPGRSSKVRKNLEKMGYEVLPYHEQML